MKRNRKRYRDRYEYPDRQQNYRRSSYYRDPIDLRRYPREYVTYYSYTDDRREYRPLPAPYYRPLQQLTKKRYLDRLQNVQLSVSSIERKPRCQFNKDYRRHLYFKSLSTGTKKYLQPRKKHRC